MSEAAGLAPGMTVGTARRALAQAFRRHGIDSPDLDARVLVGHALALDHAGLAAAADRVLSKGELRAIAALASRRVAREPVAHILGRKEFWGLDLAISRATLVPRPDTETVVEAALAAVDGDACAAHPRRIADLGTGSGALLLALLSELPGAAGVGTDVSEAALAVARGNAARLGLAARASFVACHFASALAPGFDLVVSNPPYVATGDIATLASEVRDHDPHVALDGGADGLDAYRAIAAEARRILAPGGVLTVELGAGQGGAVTALLARAGLAVTGVRDDLSGVPRALSARLSP